MTYAFDIALSTIKALLSHAGNKDVRPYLNGIAVDLTYPSSPVLVATDNHRLLVVDLVQHADAADTDVRIEGDLPAQRVAIIPRDLLAKFKTARYAKSATVTLSTIEDGRYARVALSDISGNQMSSPTVVGTYPDYRRVLPSTGPAQVRLPVDARRFNADYLHDTVTALQLLGIVPAKHPMLPIDAGCWTLRTDVTLAELADRGSDEPVTMPHTKGVRFVLAPIRA